VLLVCLLFFSIEQWMKLWYDRPAREWVEALPIGNGRLGGMVFGSPTHERIALNEDTLYSGEPLPVGVVDIKSTLDQVVGWLKSE
jgi:alpha-L-fucosidase 2